MDGIWENLIPITSKVNSNTLNVTNMYIYNYIYIHGYNGMYWSDIPKYYLFHLHYIAE